MWNKHEHEIPRAQFEQRIEQVRAFVVEQDLSAVLVHSAPNIHQWSQTGHVEYLTNWANLDRIVDTIVVVPRAGPAVMLVPGTDYMFDQIEEVSWIENVRMVSSPDPRSISKGFDTDVAGEKASRGMMSFSDAVNDIILSHDCGGRPVGISGIEAMPTLIYQQLQSSVQGGIAAVADIVAELRQLKTPEEIMLLRKTAAISDLSYETMLQVLSDGMWGYELTAAMDHAAKRNEADFVYHCMHTAPGGDLEKGKLSIKAHDVRLRRGDYINVNAYVVHKGYWIQGDRAGTIGSSLGASAGQALRANLEVQDDVLAMIRPGLEIGELVRASEEGAKRKGYDLPGGRIGHGQGLDYSERPFLTAGSKETLKPGHVFVLHVSVGIPGTNILLNPIADLCHVTENGVEVLNQFPRGLFHT
jgi:Xaa-Pro aminopeptidase